MFSQLLTLQRKQPFLNNVMLKNIFSKTKYIIIPLLLLMFCLPVMAGNFFEESTGLKVTANKTGHTKQKIFSGANSIDTGIGQIIQIFLSLVGIIFMIFLFYGGILWMTAAGSEKRIDRAKKIMSQSIVGIIIVLMAYAVSLLIVGMFAGEKTLN